MSKRGREASAIWDYFTKKPNQEEIAQCNSCGQSMSRGQAGEPGKWQSTSLWNHLRRMHPSDYEEASSRRNATEQAKKKRKEKAVEDASIYKIDHMLEKIGGGGKFLFIHNFTCT